MLQMLMAGASLVLLILVMIILARQYQQCWQMHQQALLALVDMSERMATMECKLDAVTKRVMQIAAMPPAECDTDAGSRVRREQSGLLEGAAGSQDAVTRRSSSQDAVTRRSSSQARGLPQENVSREGKAGEQAQKCLGERTMMSEGRTGVQQGSKKTEPASPSAGMISPDDALRCIQHACCLRACMHAYTHGESTFTYATDIHAYTYADAPRGWSQVS